MRHRPLVVWFADQMETVLRENDWKGGWERMSPWSCHSRIIEELEELTLALAGQADGDVILESVDVANFCAFLAYNYARASGRLAAKDVTP